jgi:formylglycine-generating enzyme required for sulfatase activity
MKIYLKSIVLISCLILFVCASEIDNSLYYKDPKGYSFVPMGSTIFQGKHVSIQAFYISKYEVTNIEYRYFLNSLRKQRRLEEYNQAKVDSSKWKLLPGDNITLVKYYHSDRAFDNYPVVNISRKGAEIYCKWLSEEYNKLYSKGTGLKFRLPLESEWEKAAKGDNDTATYACHKNKAENDKSHYLCNFKDNKKHRNIIIKMLISKNGKKDNIEATEYIMPANFYRPNIYGLYNMSGNVAEMIDEKGRTKGGSWNDEEKYIKINSPDPYEGFNEPSPFIGFRPVATFVGKNVSKEKEK